jgi:GNAT superfamily N-acetyltransferase
MYASEYFKGYDANQPSMRKSSTQRALEYARAQNTNIRSRATNFYNKLKAALGFQPAVQQMSRINELSKEKFAKPAQDIEIVKKEKYYADEYGIKQLLANAAGKRIGDITYSPSKCWINHLEVDPEQRKKGAGSKLFKSAVDQMKDCEQIRWWATPDSVPFYRKQGAQKDYYQESGFYQNMILDRTSPASRIKRNFYDRPL